MSENNVPKITYGDIDGMLKLAETNEAMREVLEQAKLIYELARQHNLPPNTDSTAASKAAFRAHMARKWAETAKKRK